MKLTTTFALTFVAALSVAQSSDQFRKGLIVDPDDTFTPIQRRTATKVGDMITILISESSASSFNATTSATKKDATTAGPITAPVVDFFKSTLFGSIMQGASTSGNSSVAGTGQTTNNHSFVAKLTVIVKEVKSNGLLVVEGEKRLRVNKDDQKVTLTGIIRPDDVASDNTVLSEFVGNAKIECDGKGVVADRQRKGILTKMLDWLM